MLVMVDLGVGVGSGVIVGLVVDVGVIVGSEVCNPTGAGVSVDVTDGGVPVGAEATTGGVLRTGVEYGVGVDEGNIDT